MLDRSKIKMCKMFKVTSLREKVICGCGNELQHVFHVFFMKEEFQTRNMTDDHKNLLE